MTLRRLGILVRHLPPESATARALGGSGWDLLHYLVADLFHATAGKAHPSRPKPSKASDQAVSPSRQRKLRQARARAAARRRAIAAGELR